MAESSSTSTPKTVFIVGAGTSKEAGLPIGSELKKSIAIAVDIRLERFTRMSNGDHFIFEAFRLAADKGPTHNDLVASSQRVGGHIRDAMPQAISIDNFIDTHSEGKEIEICGKLVIVRMILKAESDSALYSDQSRGNWPLNVKGRESAWFNSFFRRLTENCKPSDIAKRLSSVVLIIFNYDRCAEHYLYHALQSYYFMSDSDVVSLFQNLEIYHPYGTVGSLPWLKQSDTIEYGATQIRHNSFG